MLSPVPPKGTEIHSCLTQFLRDKDVNLIAQTAAFEKHDLTPDIIGDVPIERLVQLTGAPEGSLRKLHVFVKVWQARHEAKKRAIAAALFLEKENI